MGAIAYVGITGSSLSVGQPGGTINNSVLKLSGAGSVHINGITGIGSLSIAAGSVDLQLTPFSGLSQQSSLVIGSGSKLDINNNHVIVNYGSSSDPITTIAGYIKNGYNAGGWNGPGIDSTFISLTTGYGIGFADGADGVVAGLSSGQIEIKYTLLGDANLDGTVNGSDFSLLAANFGTGHTNWDQGNFLFSSSVNGSDFSALAANFGQGDSGADVGVSAADVAGLDAFAAANGLPLPAIGAVPEPASAGIVILSGLGMLAVRRRRG